jgi:hypothetical protein
MRLLVLTLEVKLAFVIVLLVVARKFYVDEGLLVFSAMGFVSKVELGSSVFNLGLRSISFTARTAVTIFFTSDVDLLLCVALILRREVDGVRRLMTFPSGALLFVRKLDLSFYVGFGGCFNGVAPVRRREDAEGDRDSGFKVQVDYLSVRELFSNAFRRAERKTRRDLLLLLGRG